KRAASGGLDKVVIVWNLETRKEICRLEGNTQVIQGVAFSPDGQQVISIGSDRKTRWWDVESAQELGRIDSGVHVAELVGDGKHPLCGVDNDIELWDLENKKILKRFTGHTGAVYAFAVSPDGRTLLSAGHENTLRLWNMDSAKEIRAIQAPANNFFYSAIFVDEGRQILAASQDGAIALFDAATGKQLHVFRGHDGHVHSLALTRDRRRVLSGGGDGTLRLWDLTR